MHMTREFHTNARDGDCAAHPENGMPPQSQPVHRAEDLTAGGNLASIVLGGQVYTLRITRAGKLILTK